jgi:hypothetical protein
MTVAIALMVEPAGVLPNREVRSFALGRLPIGSGQRRPNQRTMHGPLVFGFVTDVRFQLGHRVGRLGASTHVEERKGSHYFFHNDRGLGFGHGRTGERSALGSRDQRRLGLLAPRRRNLGLLVLVVRIARGAAGLLHHVFNHRDHRMIGDAALARTIVVENVTEPKPALLHELPRSDAFRWGR